MLRVEVVLILVAIVMACIRPLVLASSRWFGRAELRFSTIARRQTLSVFLVGMLALSLRIAVLPVEPIPDPVVHDEFGYLLIGDTLAHGRIANPTPPLWEHFETFHVMFHPHYASIYPPAQGVFLAIGSVVFGHPFWGVWLSCGLMCAAITWMLQAWIGPEWALLGGIIAVLRYGVFGYWADSYWGGAVAAIGGALVLGALPRLKASPKIQDALLMGVGLGILANSRPYEGFVFSVPIMIILIVCLVGRKSPAFKVTLPRVVVPLAIVLTLTAAVTGYYLWRLTGSPVRMPYQIERKTYAIAPYFLWQPVRPEPVYHHAAMRKMFVEEEMLGLQTFRSVIGIPFRAYVFWGFFLGPLLTFPFLMLAVTAPADTSFRTLSPQTKTLLFFLVFFIGGSMLVNFYSPHYSAPATGLFVLLLLLAMKQLRKWGSAGLFLARAVALICVLSFGLRASARVLHIPVSQYYAFNWDQENWPDFGRTAIQKQLLQIPGKHLVIVHYRPDHEPFAEWVYNEADMDSARILWARDMGPVADEKLAQQFGSRKAWVLEADEKPPRLHPLD